jgi:secondary thiamine-phosphate synthase enzyme
MMKNMLITLPALKRGFHIITPSILNLLPKLPVQGMLNLFIQHTSAGLAINENSDPSVLHDLNKWFDENIRENENYYLHTLEGPDDMPAHIKSILCSTSLSIPIVNHQLALGIWQGIYLCEFRNNGGPRKIIATIMQ